MAWATYQNAAGCRVTVLHGGLAEQRYYSGRSDWRLVGWSQTVA